MSPLQIAQLVFQVLGVLATLGVITWLVRQIRRPDLIIEIEFIPKILPPTLIDGVAALTLAAEKTLLLTREKYSADLRVNSSGDLLGKQMDELETLLKAGTVSALREIQRDPSDLGKIVVTAHNRAPQAASDVRLYFHDRWRPHESALRYLWSISLQGPFSN